jgi:hypothetical protein
MRAGAETFDRRRDARKDLEMARTPGTAAGLAIAIASAVFAAPAAGALRPVHNRHALEHAIHQKEKELVRVQAHEHNMYEDWLRALVHHEKQKRNLLARFEEHAASCEGTGVCGAARIAHVSEEKERLSGEIQADESLANMPEPGEARVGKRAAEHAHELEEGIQQREAELAALPARAVRVPKG